MRKIQNSQTKPFGKIIATSKSNSVNLFTKLLNLAFIKYKK